MKRFVILITISVVILLAIGAAIYYWFGRSRTNPTDAITAIPIESSAIFRIENFANLSQSIAHNKLCKNLSKIYEIKDFVEILTFTDSLYQNNQSFQTLFTQNPIYVALCAAGGGGNRWILSLKLNSSISRTDIYDIARALTMGAYAEDEARYNQTAIVTFQNPNQNFSSYSVAVQNNILIVSNSKLLVENALGQIYNRVSLNDNPQFLDIQKISGKGVEANLFVNYKQIPAILKSSVNSNHLAGTNTFADLALWTELDLSFSNNNLIISGLSNVADSTNSFLRILVNQKPVVQSLPNILPASTGAFIWIGVSDQEKYLADYRDYLDRKRQLFKYTQRLSTLKSQLGIGVEDLFSKIVVDQIALAFMPSVSVNESDSWFIVANTNSPSATLDLMQKFTKTYISRTNQKYSNWETTISIDNDKKVKIYRSPAPGIYNALWGSMFSTSIDAFYCFVENNIVFGESVESLTRFVKAAIRNNTLGKDVNFNKFANEISKKGNFCFYANPSRSASLIRSFTKSPIKQFFLSLSQSGVLGISYQMIGGNSYIFNSLTLTSGKLIRTSSNQTAWVTKLDERPIIKPQIVVNHNTREHEIFIQDSLNNIYLINNQGRVLWKRGVDGRICSDVEQIDVYSNGRLQFAFNTPTMIYVVDRNGKDVSGFPIKLPADATNPLSVVDYDNNRNYRLFQACADKRVYVYDSKGKIVNGWTFGKTETTVTSPINFFRMAGKDYILIFDSNRPYIVNRRGEERVKPNDYFTKAKNSNVAITTDNRGVNCFITSDTCGLIRTIATDGRVESIALRTFSPNHTFCFDDVNSDGHKDYIILDGQTISAFNKNLSAIYSTNIPDKPEPKLLTFKMGEQKKIGLVSSEADNIYLINSMGKTENTFPLQGSTPFAITRFKPNSDTYNLVVGTKQGAVVNYEIK